MRKIHFLNLALVALCSCSNTLLFSVPENLYIHDNILSWKCDNSFSSFNIYLNNKLYKNTTTAELNIDSVEDGFHRFNVSTILENQESEQSNPIFYIKDTKEKLVNLGENFYLSLDYEGHIRSYGDNTFHQLGHDSTTNLVNLDKKITMVSAGSNYSLALDENGDIYSWGGNEFGQLGLGNKDETSIPTKINSSSKFVYIYAGDFHALAIDSLGALYGWGKNDFNQASTLDEACILVPTKMNFEKYTSVFAGYDTTVAIDVDGNIHVAGNNLNGLLSKSKEVSIKMRKEYSETKFDFASISDYGILGIRNDGNLFSNKYDFANNNFYPFASILGRGKKVYALTKNNDLYQLTLNAGVLTFTRYFEFKISGYTISNNSAIFIKENTELIKEGIYEN